MFVSVTRLRIIKLRFLPKFVKLTLMSLSQTKKAYGFVRGSVLADRKLTFWTLTTWRSEADMRTFMSSGQHKVDMPYLLEWCDEASVVHWEQLAVDLPSWSLAARRMKIDGRPSKVRNPSAGHLSLAFAEPRLSASFTFAAARIDRRVNGDLQRSQRQDHASQEER